MKQIANIISLVTPKSATNYLKEKTTIRQAVEKFDYHKFSVVPIIDEEGKYLTTVSEGDILRYIKNCCDFNIEKAENTLVLDIDHYRGYQAVRIDATYEEVFELIISQNFIPVVDDRGIYVGIIRRRDVILAQSDD